MSAAEWMQTRYRRYAGVCPPELVDDRLRLESVVDAFLAEEGVRREGEIEARVMTDRFHENRHQGRWECSVVDLPDAPRPTLASPREEAS